ASAAQAQNTDRQILVYTDGWTVTEEGSEDAEHERSVTVTYEGLVYPVAYDLTVLSGGRDAARDQTVTRQGDDGWHNRESHRKNALRILVPATDIGQVLAEGAVPTSAGERNERHAARSVPAHDRDGHTPPSIRPEVAAAVLDALPSLLGLVPEESVPRSVLSRFADYLTGRALLGWIESDSVRRAGEELHRSVVPELGPRELESFYEDLLGGPGIRWSTRVVGPLGAYTVALTLRATQELGQYLTTTKGWTSTREITATKTSTTGSGDSRTRSVVSRTALRVASDGPVGSVRAILRGVGKLKASHDASVSVEDSDTTSYQTPESEQVVYSHGLGLELTVVKTAHARRVLRVLSLGAVDWLTPAATSKRLALDVIPNAVRTTVPSGELGPGQPQREPVAALPTHRDVRANSINVHFVVQDIVAGTVPGESSGRTPTPVPEAATMTLDAINIGTRPTSLAAHLPEAMSERGYRIDGLALDSFNSAGYGVPNPLSALVLRASLESVTVLALGDEPGEFATEGSTTVSGKDKVKAGPSLRGDVRLEAGALTEFPRLVPDIAGVHHRGSAYARFSGPSLSWQRTSVVSTKVDRAAREDERAALPYLVVAVATWTVTPEYQGETPATWNVPRTARDTVYVYTDGPGLVEMGLAPPLSPQAAQLFARIRSQLETGFEPGDVVRVADVVGSMPFVSAEVFAEVLNALAAAGLLRKISGEGAEAVF